MNIALIIAVPLLAYMSYLAGYERGHTDGHNHCEPEESFKWMEGDLDE